MVTEFGDKVVRSDLPFNCGVDIDWQTRDVKFNYPQKELHEEMEVQVLFHKINMAYFAHAFVPVLAVIATGINGFMLLHQTNSIFSPQGMAFFAVYYHLYQFYPTMVLFLIIMTYGWLFFQVFGFMTLFGWLSVLLHRTIKPLSNNFAVTNSWLKQPFMRKTTIDLSQKFGKNWVRRGSEIIIPNVSPVVCELTIPVSLDRSVRRIYTICTQVKPTILAGKFWMIIVLMNSDVNEGVIEVRY